MASTPTAAAAPARVDVLRVMDTAQDLLGQMSYSQTANALNEALAAVRELIEAAKLHRRAYALDAKSPAHQRGSVAGDLGLPADASLWRIKAEAFDRFEQALLDANGTGDKARENSAIIAMAVSP